MPLLARDGRGGSCVQGGWKGRGVVSHKKRISSYRCYPLAFGLIREVVIGWTRSSENERVGRGMADDATFDNTAYNCCCMLKEDRGCGAALTIQMPSPLSRRRGS